jgi:5-methylcytosine-specific restriction endonuclease McrA
MAPPLTQRLRHRRRPDAATIEHVVPRSQGGAAEWSNEVAACRTCNASKADRGPTEDELRRLSELKKS